MTEGGFTSVESRRGDLREVGVGVLGYRFMAKAHSNAYQRMPMFFWPPAARPRLVAICGRTEAQVAEAAVRYGYEGYYTDWRRMVDDQRVQIFDNCSSSNAHSEPTIAAARAGKHVFCEKPLALSAAEAKAMWQAADKAGVKHMTGFNYRFVPAVCLAQELVAQGVLGEIYHFRARYLQEGGDNPHIPFSWRYDRIQGGYGALSNIGVHIIDLARFLVGEIRTVTAMTATFIKERPLADRAGEMGSVTTDDAFAAVVGFANGAIGTLEASKVATGRKNQNTFEVNGSKGSLVFDLERLNELQVYLKDSRVEDVVGFTNVSVTEDCHPFSRLWWPHGHILGWEHSFVHELEHFVRAVVDGGEVGPHGATFEDGYRALAVADAVLKAADTGTQVQVGA